MVMRAMMVKAVMPVVKAMAAMIVVRSGESRL